MRGMIYSFYFMEIFSIDILVISFDKQFQLSNEVVFYSEERGRGRCGK
jgi:hypothetical protein